MTVPAIPSDPGLPGARGLFTGEGERVVGAFLEERGWHAEATRPVQAMYRPGRSCLVRYRVDASGSSGRAGLTICVEERARPRRTVSPPEDFGERFGIADPVGEHGGRLVWAFPYDPTLRDLPDAAWGPAVRDRLAGDRPAAVAVQPLRYRPRRRGVFRYRTLRPETPRRWDTRFGKVLPSDKARRAASLAPALRRVRGDLQFGAATPAGRQLVVSDELEGRSLRELLIAGASLPSPARVAAVPERLAASLRNVHGMVARRPSPMELAEPAGRMVTTILPALEGRVARILDAVGSGVPAADETVVHGDLYEAQVLVARGWRLGLIDLDDVSVGDPAMDAANFSAHLLVLALAIPAAAGRLVAYRRLVRPAFAAALGVSEDDLAWREAACMLQLATGPFRVLDPAWPAEVERRVDLAVRLLG